MAKTKITGAIDDGGGLPDAGDKRNAQTHEQQAEPLFVYFRFYGQPSRGGYRKGPHWAMEPPEECAPPAPVGQPVPVMGWYTRTNPKEKRHRHYEEEDEWGCGNWFEYMLVVVLASLLLLGSITITLFWILYYREGFAWTENPKRQFNLHPVLMVSGFITFSGFSILLYRICRCCRRIYVKLFHMIFHALAIPCVVVGFLAVFDSHNLANPAIPNFYSLHSWLGMVTMGLFALQFIVGFFSFLILLCCDSATAAFRASLVPIHASFGITTFMLAVATCLTGLTEDAFFKLGKSYSDLGEQALVMNGLAMVLVASAIVIGYITMRKDFRFRGHMLVTVHGE